MSDFSLHFKPESQALLDEMLRAYLKEQKRKSRWRWFMRVLSVLILFGLIYLIAFANSEETGGNTKPHVGLVDLNGEIFDTKGANADDFAKSVESAYKNSGLKAIVFRINSPGGSPVQAEYMYQTVHHYRKKYPEVKTYAVCVDMCASAAYYVAAAAEEIYASPASMVGSIGVVYSGFGFSDFIAKVGISRRLQTAGANKGFLDPFSPESETQKQRLQTMLNEVHEQFIHRVKEGRGKRLHATEETFSGLIWTGEQALPMGLIDGFASSGQLARDIVKLDSMIDYTHKPSLFDKVSKNIGTAAAEQLVFAMGMTPQLR